MSVHVKNLTKYYGSQAALDKVTFQAKRGEITGFLGPNGAGKTTTMKIITTNLSADEGVVTVSGLDVNDKPLEVRRKVGYLTEHNALYFDMYVREYLSFIAGVYKVSNKRKAVDEMIDRTGLSREAHKKIGMLSKGYKQRVGLAQALIHDPEVLILDEPTSGLDPNQLVDIRRLIKDLGKEKTVIFSTHIMQEVQALCDKVVIINKGKIVADEPIEALGTLLGREQTLRIELASDIDLSFLGHLDGVLKVEKIEGSLWKVAYKEDLDIRQQVFELVIEKSGVILEMYRDRSTVEDFFQTVTQ